MAYFKLMTIEMIGLNEDTMRDERKREWTGERRRGEKETRGQKSLSTEFSILYHNFFSVNIAVCMLCNATRDFHPKR